MTIAELEILLKDFIEEGKYIYKTFEDETYIFVFTKLEKLKGIDHDDRFGRVGGPGPIVVDKRTKEFKRVHYMDVPTELLKKNSKEKTVDSIAKGIIKRKYVNEGDVYNFLKLNYKGNEKFTFGKVLYNLEKNIEIFSLQFKNNELRNRMVNFLEVLNVKCEIKNDGWLLIFRVL